MKKSKTSLNFRTRVVIPFNTGTRVEQQKRGKGSYKRHDKFRKDFV